jgi:phosphatidylserine decarboxylase
MPVNGIQHLILDVACWDKDRFGKDYLGEFELALEEIFANNKTEQEPKWYPLRSKRPGKKTGNVSGEVLLQFTLYDNTNTEATAQQIFDKLQILIHAASADSPSLTVTPGATPMLAPTKSNSSGNAPPPLRRTQTDKTDLDDDEDDYEVFDDETPEDDDPSKPETAEKRKRRLRIKGLKRRKRNNPYEFSNGGSDVVGIVYLEICNIKDLPPESNLTRTSFDMDPFVVASLGKKTYRTKVVRHNLNPTFNEKMLFHVQGHEQQYSFLFTVIDRDKYSGNDFIASVNLPLQDLIGKAPQADPETGLYELQEPHEFEGKKTGSRSRFIRLPLSRSSSAQSLNKMARPAMSRSASGLGSNGGQLPPTPGPAPTSNPLSLTTSHEVSQEPQQMPSANTGLLGPGEPSAASNPAQSSAPAQAAVENAQEQDDQDFNTFELPLKMKNVAKWEDKHNPVLHLRAKYVPYPALRQQFWRAMLKQYDTDDSGRISKVELTTMLDTLGSTLRESTIDSFFQRFPHKAKDGEESWELTKDEVVICLEDQLSKPRTTGPSMADKIKGALPDAEKMKSLLAKQGKGPGAWPQLPSEQQTDNNLLKPQVTNESQASDTSTLAVPDLATPGEEGDYLERDDLNVDRGEEHVVEIRECPICHQPRLNRRKDTDIITHIATCASSDWRQVNNLMMGGFVTASQAQRKWYSKVMTKISYGGYKLGANSANILVQDRITGQISEEKMSVYVRLGIRLLYKGIKSKDMETRRSKWGVLNVESCRY